MRSQPWEWPTHSFRRGHVQAESAITLREVPRERFVLAGIVPGDLAAIRIRIADRLAAVHLAATDRTIRFVAGSRRWITTNSTEGDGEAHALSGRAIVDRAIIVVVAVIDSIAGFGHTIPPGNQDFPEVVAVDHPIEIEVATGDQVAFCRPYLPEHQADIDAIDLPVAIQVALAGVAARRRISRQFRAIGLNSASHATDLLWRKLAHANLP